MTFSITGLGPGLDTEEVSEAVLRLSGVDGIGVEVGGGGGGLEATVVVPSSPDASGPGDSGARAVAVVRSIAVSEGAVGLLGSETAGSFGFPDPTDPSPTVVLTLVVLGGGLTVLVDVDAEGLSLARETEDVEAGSDIDGAGLPRSLAATAGSWQPICTPPVVFIGRA